MPSSPDALIAAIEQRDARAVSDLLAHGCDPNAAADNQRLPLLAAVAGGQHAMVELLLRHKANANGASQVGYSPLMAAARNRDERMLDLLLGRGADAKHHSDSGHSVADWLFVDAATDAQVLACLKKLVQAGYDPLERDETGYSILISAAAKGYAETAAYLLASGVPADVTDTQGRSPRTEATKHGKTTVLTLLKSQTPSAKPWWKVW